MANVGRSNTGGSGAFFHAIVRINSTGSMGITVGSGGISSYGRTNSSTDGAASSITFGGQTMIVCGGGTKGNSTSTSTGSAGTGGTVGSNNFDVYAIVKSQSGVNGQSAKNTNFDGAESGFTGTNYGRSGSASCTNWVGGSVGASTHGYVRIRYLGT